MKSSREMPGFAGSVETLPQQTSEGVFMRYYLVLMLVFFGQIARAQPITLPNEQCLHRNVIACINELHDPTQPPCPDYQLRVAKPTTADVSLTECRAAKLADVKEIKTEELNRCIDFGRYVLGGDGGMNCAVQQNTVSSAQIQTLHDTLTKDMRTLLNQFCQTYATDTTKCDKILPATK